MQIEKINENQLEITLNVDDLKRKNISLHSFMCNSAESQILFFDILNSAEEKFGFNLKNHEIIIEAFAVLAKSYFVLLITRIPKVTYLHLAKKSLSNFKFNKSFWIKFDNLQEFCLFCNYLKDIYNIKTSLYLLNNCYFLHIKSDSIKNFFQILYKSYEFSNCIFGHNFILDENAKNIIKENAIQTAIKYFA